MSDRPIQTATLRFNCDTAEGRKAARRALNVDGAYLALSEMHTALFRPAYKHGYEDQRIQELIDKINAALGGEEGFEPDSAEKLIGYLGERYREILEENGINLESDWE